eukprot:scaffold27802_cov28-Tisochrysis_lutea.AAC.3
MGRCLGLACIGALYYEDAPVLASRHDIPIAGADNEVVNTGEVHYSVGADLELGPAAQLDSPICGRKHGAPSDGEEWLHSAHCVLYAFNHRHVAMVCCRHSAVAAHDDRSQGGCAVLHLHCRPQFLFNERLAR